MMLNKGPRKVKVAGGCLDNKHREAVGLDPLSP